MSTPALYDVRLVIFDLDGTLRRARQPLRSAPRGAADWELLPNVRATIATLRARDPDLRFGVASNQDDVAAGKIDFETAQRLARDACTAAGIADAMIEICPHGDAGCSCHKPEPGMLRRIAARAGIEPVEILVVGNGDNDREAAERLGSRFVTSADFFARRPRGIFEIARRISRMGGAR